MMNDTAYLMRVPQWARRFECSKSELERFAVLLVPRLGKVYVAVAFDASEAKVRRVLSCVCCRLAPVAEIFLSRVYS